MPLPPFSAVFKNCGPHSGVCVAYPENRTALDRKALLHQPEPHF